MNGHYFLTAPWRRATLGAALALPLLFATAACAPATAPPAVAAAAPTPMKTAERGRIVIASQPTLEDLRGLRASGFTDIVNLRSEDEMREEVPFDERAQAAALGLGYTQIPIDWTSHPYRQEVVSKLASVLESSKGKVLLHCASGGRAGYVWAAYAVVHDGKTPDAALRSLELGNVWPMALEQLTGIPLRVDRDDTRAK